MRNETIDFVVKTWDIEVVVHVSVSGQNQL